MQPVLINVYHLLLMILVININSVLHTSIHQQQLIKPMHTCILCRRVNTRHYINGQWHKAHSLLFGSSLYLFSGLQSCNPEVPSKAVISTPLSKLFVPPAVGKNLLKKVWKVDSQEDSFTLEYWSAAANLGLGEMQFVIAPTTDIVAYSLTVNIRLKVKESSPQAQCSCGATAQLQNGRSCLA